MITQKTVFETPDGKQFASFEEAERYQLYADIKSAINEGAYQDELDIDESLTALLRDFNITRKEKGSD